MKKLILTIALIGVMLNGNANANGNFNGNARKDDLKALSEVAPAGNSKGLGSIKRVSEANANENEKYMNTTITMTQEWDKVFPLSERVNHQKVTFKTQYGLTLAADLYTPKEGDSQCTVHSAQFTVHSSNLKPPT